MSGNKIVIDTNIIIYHFNGDLTIEALLEEKEILISFITEIELKSYPNLSKDQLKVIDRFLQFTEIVHSNSDIASLAAKLRVEKRLKTPDAIIAATAITMELPLLSADKRLAGISGLDLITYTPST